MLGGGGGGSGAGAGGGAGLGLDLSAVIQAAVVGLVLFSAAIVAVRRAASRYFVVDAAGFAASYDNHHHSSPAYAIPPRGSQELMAQDQAAAAGDKAPCAECGVLSNRRCTGCKRVRYCSQGCQSKHWQSDHKFRCKQMKMLDPGDKLPCGVGANNKKSSGFGCISLVPSRGKFNKAIFPYDEFLKLYNWKDLDFMPCGLVNCGNSCFANVVLQCLSYTRPLVAYLLGKDHSRECSSRHEDWCFLCELQCHIQRASESLHPFAPVNILSHLPNIGGNLGFGRQEDAHEFMRFAIDKMQSACLDEFGGEKAVDLSTQETTLIQHIFGGRLQSQVQCTACGMVSNRYDNMMDLTVEIQGDAESLEECLDQFTAIEWLDGDNKYKCDGCKDYVKARKHLTVHQAPNILTITLKRFQSGRFGKLNKRVTFPMKLDLTPYMSMTDGSDLYDLYAVVVHLDMLNASFFGHYICYIKDYRGRWYRIDDCKVMAAGEEEVHAQGAYMLLYSRRTARPKPLIAVKEPVKQQQQCKVPPSKGQNHMITEDVSLNCESVSKPPEDHMITKDVSLNCESVSKPSEDLHEDPKCSNGYLHKLDTMEDLHEDSKCSIGYLHKLDTMDRVPNSDLHISIDRDKSDSNKNLHLLVSPVSHVLDEATRDPGSPLEGSSLRYLHFDNYTCEASSIHSSAVQCEKPSSCIESADYMEVDTEAGTEVERSNVQQQPVLGDSIGAINNETSVPTLQNGMAGAINNETSVPTLQNGKAGAINNETSVPTLQNGKAGKPKPLFSFGFLDKPLRKKSSYGDKGQIDDNIAASSQRLNGHCCGVLANSCSGPSSSGSAKCNGDMFAASSNENYPLVNGDKQSSINSLHVDMQHVPIVTRGFIPRPYSEPTSSNTNQNDTSNNKPSVHDHNKSFRNSWPKECQGDMSFLTRGFLEREKLVKGDDDLPFSNGKPSPSFVNGNNKSSSSHSSKGDNTLISPGISTKHCRESAAMGNSASPMHDQKTSLDIPIEQPNGIHVAVLPDQIGESWRPDYTTNGPMHDQKTSLDIPIEQHHGIHVAVSLDQIEQHHGIHVAVSLDQIGESSRPDYTTNGTVLQCRPSSVDVTGHLDENGHAISGTNNTRCGESGDDGNLDVSGSSYQRDETSAMLVSERGIGSENADRLKYISATLEHDGLRRRLTSKFPEQNSIDAQ